MTRSLELPDSSKREFPGFDLSSLPGWAFQYVTPSVDRSRRSVFLEAGPWVGSIPLADGSTLHLVPRAGVRSFGRMIAVAEGLDHLAGDLANEVVEAALEPGENKWPGLFAKPYFLRLRELEKQSLLLGRLERRGELSFTRGRVHVAKTQRRIARAAPDPVTCTWSTVTYDTPENRFLGWAAKRLLQGGHVPAESMVLADRWARSYGRTPPKGPELHTLMGRLSEGRYSGDRGYYQAAMLMARSILFGAEVVFDDPNAITEPHLTNVNDLFETYCRVLIARALSPAGVLVEKPTSGLHATALYTDGTCELIPDLLLSRAEKVIVVGDAKYKPHGKLASSDHQQIATYMSAFGTDLAFFVLPVSGDAPSGITSRTIRNGRVVYELRFSMDDPEHFEERLETEVRRLSNA